VRSIKNPQVEALKRVNINIPIATHNSFKAAAAARGESMTDVLLEFIENYVKQHEAAQKKGRRG
jgi:hypothetical protein